VTDRALPRGHRAARRRPTLAPIPADLLEAGFEQRGERAKGRWLFAGTALACPSAYGVALKLRTGVVAGMVLALSACAGGSFRPPSDLPVKIGRPYAVRGTTFVPSADPTYDVLGYAS
jgi:hypothetical protein